MSWTAHISNLCATNRARGTLPRWGRSRTVFLTRRTSPRPAKTGSKPRPDHGNSAPPQQPSAQPSAISESSSKPAGQLTLDQSLIVDGQVAITDLQKHQSRAVYDHIDISVNDFAPDKQFSMKVAALAATPPESGPFAT